MKSIVLAIALITSPLAMAAHESDRAEISQAQIEAAKNLPQTTVFRVNRQTNEVEVAHLPQKLGQQTVSMEGVTFQKVAANSEITGKAFTAANELDRTSSTSSWRFAYGGWGRGGYGGGWGYRGGYYGGGYAGYGYGGYSPYYGYTGYGYGYGWAYPYYNYVGYSYAYAPYFSFATPYYNYVYCGWGY